MSACRGLNSAVELVRRRMSLSRWAAFVSNSMAKLSICANISTSLAIGKRQHRFPIRLPAD